ncbi:hypothetical protein GGR56DRAFT_471087 [Xylariaceae sp. FL0804]|nr:hypothetical protein GGR56DRAFT_471087 [Xylariaceae sp. FL0804]
MHAREILGVAALAAGSVASRAPPAWQTCSEELLSLYAAAPTPTGKLGSYLSSAQQATTTTTTTAVFAQLDWLADDLCAYRDGMPTSLTASFSAYLASSHAWVSASSASLQHFATACIATATATAEGETASSASSASYWTSLIGSVAAAAAPFCPPDETAATAAAVSSTSTRSTDSVTSAAASAVSASTSMAGIGAGSGGSGTSVVVVETTGAATATAAAAAAASRPTGLLVAGLVAAAAVL